MSLEDGRFLVESVRYEALKGSMTDSATFVNFDINFDWFKGDQWIGNHNFQHQIEDFLVKCTLNRSNDDMMIGNMMIHHQNLGYPVFRTNPCSRLWRQSTSTCREPDKGFTGWAYMSIYIYIYIIHIYIYIIHIYIYYTYIYILYIHIYIYYTGSYRKIPFVNCLLEWTSLFSSERLHRIARLRDQRWSRGQFIPPLGTEVLIHAQIPQFDDFPIF